MGYFATQLGRARQFVRKAFEEQATPPKVGAAIALGALVGTSPLVGLHSFVAIGLASIIRLNRALTFLGSNVSFGPLLGLFITAEVVLGSHLTGSRPPAFTLERAAQEATNALGAWWAGYAIVGPATALVAGLAGFQMAKVRERKKAEAAAAERALISRREHPFRL